MNEEDLNCYDEIRKLLTEIHEHDKGIVRLLFSGWVAECWGVLAALAWRVFMQDGRGFVLIDSTAGDSLLVRYWTLKSLQLNRMPPALQEAGIDLRVLTNAVETYDPTRLAVICWVPDMAAIRRMLFADRPDLLSVISQHEEPVVADWDVFDGIPTPPNAWTVERRDLPSPEANLGDEVLQEAKRILGLL